MYAVSGGHLNTVKELMKYEFLKCDHQNEVHKNQLLFYGSSIYSSCRMDRMCVTL